MLALRDLEAVRARLRAGEIGVDQVRDLAAAHANPRTREHMHASEELLLGHACSLPFDDFAIVLRRWLSLADPDGSARDRDRVHHGAMRTSSCSATRSMSRRGVPRRRASPSARSSTGSAMPNSEPTGTTFEPAWVTRRVQRQCCALQDSAGSMRWTPSSWRQRRQHPAAALLGRVRRVVFDAAGVVIDLGRTQRVFTGGARDAVELQDRRCLWPGCGLSVRRSQIDHATDWGDLGVTAPSNGGPLCGRHNRWKSRGYQVWRDAVGDWHLVRPDGSNLDEPRAA